MPIERRLAAALLLLIGAVPLLWAYLPARPEALAAPLAALACTATAVLVPSTPWLQQLGGVLGALALVLFNLGATAITSVGIASVFPLMLMALRVPTWPGAAAMIAALGAVGSVHGAQAMSMQVLAVDTIGDVLGVAMTLGWALWIALSLVRGAMLRRDVHEMMQACGELVSASRRDRADLEAIVHTVADDATIGGVSGQGLGNERLDMAACLDDGRYVLVGSLVGEPLATLSVAWALRAAACAGQRDPAELMAFARAELDEVNPPEQLEWIGLLDTQTGSCTTSPAAALAGLPMPFRRFEHPIEAEQTAATLEQLVPAPADPPATGSAWAAALFDLVGVVAVPLGFAVTFEMAAPWVLAPLLGGLFVHVISRSRSDRSAATSERLEAAFEELVDNRDDLHHQLARLHGGLLPYQVEVGDLLATAHRLRGDVLDGSFADMLALDEDRARVLAGEIAGEGIAARFLGLAAQASMRIRVVANASNDGLYDQVRSVLRAAAQRLDFPLHLQLGVVEFERSGEIVGSGSLANMVVVPTDGDSPPVLREQARLDDATHVYLTPAGSRPGPDDTAPVLTAPLAAQKVAATIAAGDWSSERDGLASLFSLVFDGVGAPAHGTLIRLERRESMRVIAAG